MKLHERYFIVRDAQNKLDRFLLDLEQEHDLTYGEITSLLAEALAHVAKYQIRDERHPEDSDKKGDEA